MELRMVPQVNIANSSEENTFLWILFTELWTQNIGKKNLNKFNFEEAFIDWI